MDKTAHGLPFRISLVLVDGFALMSFASIVEPLRAANLLAGEARFLVSCLSLSGGSVPSSSGAKVPASPLDLGRIDSDLALVIAGGDPFSVKSPLLDRWLRCAARRGVRLGGVSGGPVIAAKAGLMAGRRMTVHWEHAPALRELFPDLLLTQSLYVVDRDRVTCAGGTAPMDYAHLLIAERHGSEFARLVSDWFLHTEVRQSEGPQRAGLMQRYGTRCRAVLEAIATMEAHIADPLPLPRLAQRVGIGTRQLSRRFRCELGQSPMEFYRNMRLDVAKSLIQSSSLSLTDIALAAGFADSAHFSKSWKRRWNSPPSESIRTCGFSGAPSLDVPKPGALAALSASSA